MARDIQDVQNVDAASPDYPNGKMRDKAGATSGTILGEPLFGDMTQFFSKLMRDSNPVVTPNGNPDNESNSYQLFTAFTNYIRNVLIATETAKGTVERSTDVEALALADTERFVTSYQIGLIFTDRYERQSIGITSLGGATISNVAGYYTILDKAVLFNVTFNYASSGETDPQFRFNFVSLGGLNGTIYNCLETITENLVIARKIAGDTPSTFEIVGNYQTAAFSISGMIVTT